jgi:hypothetical protein
MQYSKLLYTTALFAPGDLVEVRRIPQKRSTWHPANTLNEVAAQLTADNELGQNIYVGVNPRISQFKRGDKNVAIARCVFADVDRVEPDVAQARLTTVGLPCPTMTILSGHGTHFYWRLNETVEAGLWREWQKDLAALLDADPSVFNPERVMRLPGFLNRKKEPWVPCRVSDVDWARTYDLADLPIPMRSGSNNCPPVFVIRRCCSPDSSTDWAQRCRAYLHKCPGAVSGAGGHGATWYAANLCNRFGLTLPEAMDTMRWFSGTKCDPAWSEDEIEHKVNDAYRRNVSEHGQKQREIRQPSSRQCVFEIRRRQGAA